MELTIGVGMLMKFFIAVIISLTSLSAAKIQGEYLYQNQLFKGLTMMNLTNSIRYYNGNYDENHWAIQPLTLDDPKVFALANFQGIQFAAYLI